MTLCHWYYKSGTSNKTNTTTTTTYGTRKLYLPIRAGGIGFSRL